MQGSTFMEHKRQNKTKKPIADYRHKYMYIFSPVNPFMNTFDCGKWCLVYCNCLCDCTSKFLWAV